MNVHVSVVHCDVVTTQCSTQTLQELNLKVLHNSLTTDLGAASISVLSEVLCRKTSSKELNIKIVSEESRVHAEEFDVMLRQNKTLRSIKIPKCDTIGPTEAAALAVAEKLSQ